MSCLFRGPDFRAYPEKPYKIPKASEYFFKYLQSLQYFLKLVNIVLEFIEALQNPQSYRIYFQAFTNTPVLLEVAKHFLEFLEALHNPQSFRIFFQAFTNTPVLPEVDKHFSRIYRSPT